MVWSPEISTYARNALAPAVISRIVVDEAENLLEVTVPDDQLTSAIGRKGQNVKLAAKLLGWKIDIFTETRYNETNAIGRGLEQVASVAEVSVDSLVSAGFTTLEQLQGRPMKNCPKSSASRTAVSAICVRLSTSSLP